MSVVQCPVCALRFRFQSELEAHAHDDHCTRSEVHLPPHAEPRHEEPVTTSRLLRYP
ncbi:MAG: hypothetical protein JWN08_2045 [Frankiales bacterium]|nr:hypothetical protein [Frankiales bacterium]